MFSSSERNVIRRIVSSNLKKENSHWGLETTEAEVNENGSLDRASKIFDTISKKKINFSLEMLD